MQLAPRDKFKLSSFELLYVDPGLKKGKLNSLEMEQLMYAPQVGETTKVLTDYGTRWCLHPLTWPSIASGQETGCIWKPREQQFARSVQSQREWTPLGDPKQEVEIFGLEVSGVTPWGHHMAVKWPWSHSLWRKKPGARDPLGSSCDPLSDLKLLFWKTTKCDQGYSGHNSEPPPQDTLLPVDKRPRYLHY